MLKLTTILLMLIDHLGIVYGDDPMCRILGRPCLPLFVYLVVVGYSRTRDIFKYLKRVLLFAVISQLPYIVFNQSVSHLNVLFLLACLIIFLWLLDQSPGAAILFLLFGSSLANLSDLFAYPFIYVMGLGVFFRFFTMPSIAVLIIFFTLVLFPWPLAQFLAVFSILIILLVPDNKIIPSRFFYWFYPLHLIFLIVVRNIYLTELV